MRFAFDQPKHQIAVERHAQRVEAIDEHLLLRAQRSGLEPVRAVAAQRCGRAQAADSCRRQPLRVAQRAAVIGQRPRLRSRKEIRHHTPALAGECTGDVMERSQRRIHGPPV